MVYERDLSHKTTMEAILQNTLNNIEERTGKLYTLTLHPVGSTTDENIVVGRLEDRKCQWRVEIFPQRQKFNHETVNIWNNNVSEEKIQQDMEDANKPVDMEEDIFYLNGVYSKYSDIEEKITELRLKNAVELFNLDGEQRLNEMGPNGSLKSYRMLGRDKGKAIWETTCGACGDVQKGTYINNLCQGKIGDMYCSSRNAKPTAPGVVLCNNFQYLIPETILDNIRVGDGKIYHAYGGRYQIYTYLGKITPVRQNDTSCDAPSPSQCKELAISSC